MRIERIIYEDTSMVKMAFVSSCTAVLAVIGFYMGFTISGPTLSALVPAIAGGAGGYGIGCALLDVANRWRMTRGLPTK